MTPELIVTAFASVFGILLVLGMILPCIAIMRRKAIFQVSHVRWFRIPSNRPAVYILRSKSDPKMFKVGYTSRRVEARAAEIAARNGPVEIVAWMRMPHAYVVEQRAHSRMRSSWRVKDLGGEWYRLNRRNPEGFIRSVIEGEARSVRSIARMKFAWPEGGRIGWS